MSFAQKNCNMCKRNKNCIEKNQEYIIIMVYKFVLTLFNLILGTGKYNEGMKFMSWVNVNGLGFKFKAPKEFLDANGFTSATLYQNQEVIEKILKSGTFSSNGCGHPRENVPYLDHAIIYKNPNTKVCCLVYIPYSDANEISDEVNQWAESKGLKAEIYEHSWYNGSTCLVIISLPSAKILLR